MCSMSNHQTKTHLKPLNHKTKYKNTKTPVKSIQTSCIQKKTSNDAQAFYVKITAIIFSVML